MKRRFFTFALAALTIGLLGSCSKINERIDGLDNRVYDLENEKIASIENQIAAINQSIADLETIRTNIQNLKNAQEAQGQDITDLQAKDQALEGKINDLRTYVDTELSKYATTEWAKATFATLEQLEATNTALGALEEKVNKLGETFDGELADLKTELTKAIDNAISGINATISTLEGRVAALEAMIQSMNITPAYSDGSVEAVDGILTLKCIVSPAKVLTEMESLKDSLLIYADSVKIKTKATTPAYMTIEVSEASVLDAAQGAITLTADISEYLPKGEGKALTVAVNIKNGISDFTTKFVPVTNTTGGVRTIAVQFDNFTKATLDGFTPKFANGDAIRVSNTEKSEECTVSVDGSGNATFTTTLSGALKAIYPSAAAVLSSGEADAPIATSNNIKVPASQDGDVAKAIIAKAAIAVGSTSATFTSQTALFQITPPDGVKTFTITSLKPVVNGVARTGEAVAINTEGADDAAKRVINVTVPSDGTAYVALKAGVNLSDLSFEYIIDATNGLGAMKGIPAKDIAAAGKTDATAANTKYTIDNTNWHPYVEIEMTVKQGYTDTYETHTYKWATMNIGATSATEAGKYFMWGYTDGHSVNTTGTTISDDILKNAFSDQTFKEGERGDDSKGFAWDNYIKLTSSTYSDSNTKVFTKYVFNSQTSYLAEGYAADNKEILDLADDAANANWGGSWRMPTKWEFYALISVKEWDSTNEGFKFGTSPNQIFLPLTGYGLGTGLPYAEYYGYYWSSSVSVDVPYRALSLSFDYDPDPNNENGVNAFFGIDRFRGYPVRALSE